MSRLETTRAELESARAENQRLEAENARLQERVSNTGNEVEQKSVQLTEVKTQHDGLKEDCKKLKMLYDGVLLEMQQEQEKAAEESRELHQTIDSLRSEKERVEQDAATWEQRARVMQEQKELELYCEPWRKRKPGGKPVNIV